MMILDSGLLLGHPAYRHRVTVDIGCNGMDLGLDKLHSHCSRSCRSRHSVTPLYVQRLQGWQWRSNT